MNTITTMGKIKRLFIAILIVIFGLALLGITCWLFEKYPKVLFILIGVSVICWLVKLAYDGLETIDEAEQEIEDSEE